MADGEFAEGESTTGPWCDWRGFVADLTGEKSSGGGEIADAVVAQVIEKLHACLSDVDWDGRLEDWIFQIIRNRVIDAFRFAPVVSGDAPPVRLGVGLTSEGSALLNHVDDAFSESLRSYAEALDGLECSAVLAVDYERASVDEAASRAGVSGRAVVGALDRGRAKLRLQLQRDAHSELERLGRLDSRGPGCPSCDA